MKNAMMRDIKLVCLEASAFTYKEQDREQGEDLFVSQQVNMFVTVILSLYGGNYGNIQILSCL